MTKLPLRLILVALLTGLLASCQDSTIVSRGIRIELEHIAPAADGSVQVNWRLVNPNIATYLIKASTHRITLNGTFIGTTAQPAPIGLPAQQNAEQSTKLVSAGPAAARVIHDAAATGSAAYRVESEIVIGLFDDAVDRSKLVNSGTVKVSEK